MGIIRSALRKKRNFRCWHTEQKQEFIVSLSEYNRLAEQTGQTTKSTEENQYVLRQSFEDMAEVRNRSLQEGVPVTIDGKCTNQSMTLVRMDMYT